MREIDAQHGVSARFQLVVMRRVGQLLLRIGQHGESERIARNAQRALRAENRQPPRSGSLPGAEEAAGLDSAELLYEGYHTTVRWAGGM